MMEWTHWATRMHPALRAGDIANSPYTADQRDRIKEINQAVPLNTLSRIWQVMVASVSEMQAVGNQKQCFDMLVVRLMHIADMPPVSELLKQETARQAPSSAVKDILDQRKNADIPAPKAAAVEKKTIDISSAEDLAAALHKSKELLLFSYYSGNIEVSEVDGIKIKYYDRKGDMDFAQKLSDWLLEKTGKAWNLERVPESENARTVTEQKRSALEADPMVASAMSLFGDAEIIGVSK
jgi:DNA polymerase-3 subunit gamma/tau